MADVMAKDVKTVSEGARIKPFLRHGLHIRTKDVAHHPSGEVQGMLCMRPARRFRLDILSRHYAVLQLQDASVHGREEWGVGIAMARILIANDDQDLLNLCRYILEDCGHVIETAADGRLALERIRKWHPDMVLIDWVMPYVNGAEAVAILRGDPSTRDIPILLMSASPGADVMARTAGADAFLPKPFLPAELAARAELLLGSPPGGRVMAGPPP